MSRPRVTLVLGGARSGKSRYAETLARESGPAVCVIATARALDDEMTVRIARHRADRDPSWRTMEVPVDLPDAIRSCERDAGVVVIDCLTLWLMNLFEDELDVDAAAEALAQSLASATMPVILVANEIGLGLVPESALGRAFRDAAGRLNQRMAALADRVVFMAAGLSLVLKD